MVKQQNSTRATSSAPVKSLKKNDSEIVIQSESLSNIIYLGHIPTGFFEKEMKRFFSQFGEILRVKLFRSSKTGGSKGYAFVEFQSAEVAGVVAETMDGYFLNERQLVCHVLSNDKVHDGLFLPPKKLKRTDGEETTDDAEVSAKKLDRYRKSLRIKQKRLSDMGIDFDISNPV